MGNKSKEHMEIDRDKLSSALSHMVDFYRDHHYSPTTWNYFVDSIKKVLEGHMRLSTFIWNAPPNPKEEEVDFSGTLVC